MNNHIKTMYIIKNKCAVQQYKLYLMFQSKSFLTIYIKFKAVILVVNNCTIVKVYF